jgi:hypothetical protein
VFSFEILEFFGAKHPYKKDAMQQNNFCKTLPFWLAKTIAPFNLLKALVEVTCNAFMSKNCVSIKKCFHNNVF